MGGRLDVWAGNVWAGNGMSGPEVGLGCVSGDRQKHVFSIEKFIWIYL